MSKPGEIGANQILIMRRMHNFYLKRGVGETFTLKNISDALDIDRPSVHRTLSRLIKRGFCEKIGKGQYQITSDHIRLFKEKHGEYI